MTLPVMSHGAALPIGYVANTDIVHNDLTNTSNGAICLGWGYVHAGLASASNNGVNMGSVVWL